MNWIYCIKYVYKTQIVVIIFFVLFLLSIMQKICTQCQTDFEVTEADQLFLDKISPVFNGVKYSIPAPSLCFECRHRRRITFRNDRNLYQRKCDGSGDMIISTYSPDKPFKVYGNRYWWSDAWDECSYGRDEPPTEALEIAH